MWENVNMFQYRSFDNHTEGNIKNNLFHFQSPDKFNDPFDSRIEYETNPTVAAVEYFLENNPRNIPIGFINDMHAKIKNDYKGNVDIFIKYHYSTILGQVSKYGEIRAACLSKKCDSILMWSHYAKNHEGYCLGFKCGEIGKLVHIKMKEKNNYPFNDVILCEDKDKGKCMILWEMEYTNDRPQKINPFITSQEKYKEYIYNIMLRKYVEWKYESEYRILVDEEKETLAYDTNSLKVVYLGMNIAPNNEKNMLKWLKENRDPSRIDVYKMRDCDKIYAVIPEKITNWWH